MDEENLENTNSTKWRAPILWPPSTWNWNPLTRSCADILFSLLISMAIITLMAIIVIWAASLYFAVNSAFVPSESEHLRNWLLALAGLFGAPFIVWRTLIAHQQTQINREGHYTGLFTKAVELLAADKVVKRVEFRPRFKVDKDNNFILRDGEPVIATRPDGTQLGDWQTLETTELNREVRLGAIYALERIAQDSERDSWPIVETLCSYVRNNATHPMSEKDVMKLMNNAPFYFPENWTSKIPEPRPDIYEAAKVLARRKKTKPSNGNGDRHSNTMNLIGCNLQHADLSGSNFELANFGNANLDGTVFTNSSLRQALFWDAQMSNSILVQLDGSNSFFVRANLTCASLTQSTFRHGSFVEANLEDAKMRDVDLCHSRLSKANLNGAFCLDLDARYADLQDSELVEANLTNANFEGANLKNADLTLADVTGANFKGSNLQGTNLLCVGLEKALNLTVEQLAVAFTERNLPENFFKTHSEQSILKLEMNNAWRKWKLDTIDFNDRDEGGA